MIYTFPIYFFIFEFFQFQHLSFLCPLFFQADYFSVNFFCHSISFLYRSLESIYALSVLWVITWEILICNFNYQSLILFKMIKWPYNTYIYIFPDSYAFVSVNFNSIFLYPPKHYFCFIWICLDLLMYWLPIFQHTQNSVWNHFHHAWNTFFKIFFNAVF